jgi:predicted hydrocarbon binding protein
MKVGNRRLSKPMTLALDQKSVRQTPGQKKQRHLLKQQYPHKHDHFNFEDFFSFDYQNGTVTDWNEGRNIFVSEDFIIGLIEGLEEEVGEAAGVVMYNIGYQWGLRDADFFKVWFEKEYEKKISDANSKFVLEAWWWPFITQGWGNWEVDLSDQKNGFMFINIFDSVVARTLGDVGKPVCHIYAGLFAGFFTKLIRRELGCIEIQCYSMGETYCKFLLGRKDRIDAAQFWQNEGATARDIEKQLRNGRLK